MGKDPRNSVTCFLHKLREKQGKEMSECAFNNRNLFVYMKWKKRRPRREEIAGEV